KWELLTWFGIVGGALTLFTNLGAVLKLSDWARVLVENWKEWTHAFWVWAFGWLGIRLPPVWSPLLSFLLFGLVLAFAQAVQFQKATTTWKTEDKYQGRSFELISWRTLVCLAATPLVVFWTIHQDIRIEWRFRDMLDLFGIFEDATIMWGASIASLLIAPLGLVVLILMLARFKLQASVVIGLMVIFWSIITVSQLVSLVYQDLNQVLENYSLIVPIALMMMPVLLLFVCQPPPLKPSAAASSSLR